MKVTREHYSDTRREWLVDDGARRYRAEHAWSIGSLRMEWSVFVEMSPPQVQTHWRRLRGGGVIIAAVKQYEDNRREYLADCNSD